MFVKLWDFPGYYERSTSKRPTYKNQYSRANCVWDVSPVMLWWLHTLGTVSNLQGFVWGLKAIWDKYLWTVCLTNANFWQVGLSDVVVAKYPNKFHKLLENLIFMMLSLKNSITLSYALWKLTQEKKLL